MLPLYGGREVIHVHTLGSCFIRTTEGIFRPTAGPCSHRTQSTSQQAYMQIMEHTVVNWSVHTACKQHHRVCVQISLRVLWEWGLLLHARFHVLKQFPTFQHATPSSSCTCQNDNMHVNASFHTKAECRREDVVSRCHVFAWCESKNAVSLSYSSEATHVASRKDAARKT